MKKLLTLLLLLCAVLSLATPVSADYWLYKDVSADDFVNALVAYCNHNEVHFMAWPEFALSGHDFRSYDVLRTNTTLDFDYKCRGTFVVFFPYFLPFVFPNEPYIFTGHMHVDYLDKGLGNLYGLSVYDEDKKFTARGLNWILSCENYGNTRFYANEDEPNRLKLQKYPPQRNTPLIDGF